MEVTKREDRYTAKLHQHTDGVSDVIKRKPRKAKEGNGVEADLDKHIEIHRFPSAEERNEHLPSIGEEEFIKRMT